MHLRVAGFFSFHVVLWHWCDVKGISEELQKYNISPPNMFGQESPSNKTIDELIMDAMGGLKGALNRKRKNGTILMELDMVLSEEQYYSLYEQPNSYTPIRNKRKAISHPFRRWTNGEIPYRFYQGHFNQSDQYWVRQAMTEWERYTCLRFREATSSDTNVIVFRDGGECSSHVGMMDREQNVLLSSKGCRQTKTYLHEIGHAIGLFHEHNRPDRDNHVEIIWKNVMRKAWNNFNNSKPIDQMNVPYDYSSIMHYSAKAFSKNGLETIRVRDLKKGANIGKATILSFRDVEIVNKMYSCRAKCDPSIICSGGYVDENCRCVCMNGFQDCEIGDGGTISGNTCGVNRNSDSWKCFVLAQQGECEANSKFRNKECARACGPCGLKRKPGTCVKMYPSDKCLKWSRNGDCKKNEEWMNNYCCGTCVNSNIGNGCRDENDSCLTWARNGFCKTNRDEAVRLCPITCDLCDQRQ